MSLYNILFGKNAQSALLLAAIGLKEHDVPRLRDVHVEDGGETIAVYTRMGGGNRGHWDSADSEPGQNCPCAGCRAQWVLGRHPLYKSDEDDDFDSTYATYYFRAPGGFAADVANLSDPLSHGLRVEFAQLLAKTLRRVPTEADKEQALCDRERDELKRVGRHVMANGHTFVPYDDFAMSAALKLAEENGGSLRTCWGILPLTLNVKRDLQNYPHARDPKERLRRTRVLIDYEWKIDVAYWQHCQELFAADYPVTMAKIAEAVARYLPKEVA